MSTMNRRVPRSTLWRLFLSGTTNQICWLALGIGMILGWIMIFNVDLSFVYYWGNVEHVTGTITDSYETNVSVNDKTVFVNSYRFTTSDGRSFEDFSYATGRWSRDGDKVTIEYPAGKPHLSRIQGMQRKMFGPLGLLFGLGPVAGLVFAYVRVRKILQTKHLLQHGKLSTGVLVDKKATGTEINDESVYKLTFAFTADDGREYHVVHKTHKTAALEDDNEERLLYDPLQPEIALMVDTLPGLPDFNKNGHLRQQSVSVASFALPILTLGGHGLYVLSVLF
ncbi:MAG: hypothetical protein O7G88_19135 [bacterium]|nr:hypothetical protein [bacterium]